MARPIYDRIVKLFYLSYFPFFPYFLNLSLLSKLPLSINKYVPNSILSVSFFCAYYIGIYYLIKVLEKAEKVLFPVEWYANQKINIRRLEDEQIKYYVSHIRRSINRLEQKEYLNQRIKELVKKLDSIPSEEDLERIFEANETEFEIRRLTYTVYSFKSEIIQHYGSFMNALAENGYIVKQNFGVRVKAKSGNLCFSMAELAIDNWLFENNFRFEKEPLYPHHYYYNKKTNKRADWKVEGLVFIEYFGMIGYSTYDRKVEIKRKLAVSLGLVVVEIYEADLKNINKKLKMLNQLIAIQKDKA